MKWIIFELLVFIRLSFSTAPDEILILILSQPDPYHSALSTALHDDIRNQSSKSNISTKINVKILHEIVDHPGYWTFLATLPYLDRMGYFDHPLKWVVFCEDESAINLVNLIKVFRELDWSNEIYFGHPIRDKEATIIHHFAFFEKPQWFPYPLIRSGLAFSTTLLKTLAKRIQEKKPASDFFIDASHELSLYIWQNMRTKTENNKLKSRPDISLRPSESCQENQDVAIAATADKNGDYAYHTRTHGNDDGLTTKLSKARSHKLLMTESPYFCQFKRQHCAIYASERKPACDRVDIEEIYFAIKTYHRFHNERIPIIEKTWAQYTVHKKYFSDVDDRSVPTFTTNVPNTETGHCSKTLSIFKLALKDIDKFNAGHPQKPIKWIFLCDDDTLLSVSRVCDILGCFNATQYIYLGERYGYRLHSKDGFNYITGGGGMAVSLPTTRKIITSCVCPTMSSPDDMIIGMCLQRLGIKAIHSSRFHQARPSDYAAKLLAVDQPVSFHKFWQIDPVSIYTKWFQLVDHQKWSIGTKSNKSLCDMKARPSTNFVKESLSSNVETRKTQHIEL